MYPLSRAHVSAYDPSSTISVIVSLSKAESPMKVTVSGIVAVFNLGQAANASSSIVSRVSGNVNSSSLLQPLKPFCQFL